MAEMGSAARADPGSGKVDAGLGQPGSLQREDIPDTASQNNISGQSESSSERSLSKIGKVFQEIEKSSVSSWRLWKRIGGPVDQKTEKY